MENLTFFAILKILFLAFLCSVFFILIVFAIGYIRCVIVQEIELKKEKKEREKQKEKIKRLDNILLISLLNNEKFRISLGFEKNLLEAEMMQRKNESRSDK